MDKINPFVTMAEWIICQ